MGDNQPPKKHIDIIIESHSMLLYSAKKKSANVIAEYSTLKPATSSASASGRSKGALFVSAKRDIKKTMHTGNNGKQNHTPTCCCRTISSKLKEFAQMVIGKSSRPMETSYEIN